MARYFTRKMTEELCAFLFPDQLLKMKNSEEFKKDVADPDAPSSASSAATPMVPEVPTPSVPSIKPPDPEMIVPETNSTPGSAEGTSESCNPEKSSGSTEIPTNNINIINEELELGQGQPMETETTPPAGSETPAEVKSKEQISNNLVEQPESLSKDANKKQSLQQPEKGRSSLTPTVTLPAREPIPSTSSASVPSSKSHASLNNNYRATNVHEADAMSTGSSTDEEEDPYIKRYVRNNRGPGNSDPPEELVIKKNTEYLLQRCTSLMERVQGIMQATTARHVSKQLQGVLEHPGLNPALRPHHQNRTSLQDYSPPQLTKQGLAEVQFTGKLMSNIIRHSMCRQLDPNADSATEESDTDDDEVVLPDERMMELGQTLKPAPYLPVENNPFIEAIKLEKQYEARRTTLEYSINECEYSITKSLHLRKHCKARKPQFQLEKPPVSSNIINIPVDHASSVKFYHDSKPTTTKRVSDMIHRRSSLEQERVKINGNGDAGKTNSSQNDASKTASSSDGLPANSLASSASGSVDSSLGRGGSNDDRNQEYVPTIKSLGSDGLSVLGVEFVNSSDPHQSSSRCSAIKRPDNKNRKIFQLGGIQNIFRDPFRLPTVRCTCFGRNELCALCLGRSKKKAEVNHVFMSHKDKLAILDETFHKSLSLSEDIPLEVLLTASSVGNASLIPPSSNLQQIIKARSEQFPPDFLETGPKPKKPRVYDIKPYVESPVRSPKKDGRYSEESPHAPRKRPPPRKSQSSFEDKEFNDYAGKGLGWPSRERKDSMRRTRNQEFDIDNIVIPYSIAASTRVEQLVYKPIETPRWRVLEYSEIFAPGKDGKPEGELEDMSNAAFLERHNKCEIEEKKRFTQSIKKALNATRKTRRLDSTGRSESISEIPALSNLNTDDAMAVTTPPPVSSPGKSKDKETSSGTSVADENKGTSTPVTDTATVITEAMANQALKSLFKVGRRRTISTTIKVEVEEEETPVVSKLVDPWPQRKFPLTEEDYKEMVEVMQKNYPDCPVGITSHSSSLLDDPPTSPKCL